MVRSSHNSLVGKPTVETYSRIHQNMPEYTRVP